MSTEKTIVEINGVKLEVDMRYARRVEEMRVGDQVKVMIKGYSDESTIYNGIVVGFEPFPDLPTIRVAYVEETFSKAEVKFLAWNARTKNAQIVVADREEDFGRFREKILAAMDRAIAVKNRELEEIEAHKRYFLTEFGSYWAALQPRIDAGDGE